MGLLVFVFALAVTAYGAWVVLAMAQGRQLTLGDVQLGVLALFAGALLLMCSMLLIRHSKSPR